MRYVRAHPGIRPRLLVVAAVSFLVTPYAVLMPLFASEIFHGDARTYGFLIGCAGAGSLLAGFYLASRKGTDGLARRATLGVIAAGVALSLFAVNQVLPLAFAIVMALGFAAILVIAGSDTLIQVWVEDSYRGRVMAMSGWPSWASRRSAVSPSAIWRTTWAFSRPCWAVASPRCWSA